MKTWSQAKGMHTFHQTCQRAACGTKYIWECYVLSYKIIEGYKMKGIKKQIRHNDTCIVNVAHKSFKADSAENSET